MRTSLAIALSLLVAMVGLPTLASAADAPEPVIKQGDRLAMLGDSITDQRQYTCFIETYLTACMPQLDIWCFEFGWGGETAGGFVAYGLRPPALQAHPCHHLLRHERRRLSSLRRTGPANGTPNR
jgi:hypothetical protein